MNDILIHAASFSIFIPGIIALVRWKEYDAVYYPFVFFIWLSCLNEMLGTVLVMNNIHTTVNNNIYVLLASIFIVWFFSRAEIFKKNSKLQVWLIGLYLIIWLLETFVLRSIHYISSYFRIVFSLATVLMSISLVNLLLIQSSSLLKEGSFWICTGFIIHFTIKILVELFWLYGITNEVFQQRVFDIQIFANLITNLTYALAALWINRKKPYSLQW